VEGCSGFEAQAKELKALGCARVFKEQVCSVALRPQLERALDALCSQAEAKVEKITLGSDGTPKGADPLDAD
jgi:exodeoxyribonuclease VII small subunit